MPEAADAALSQAYAVFRHVASEWVSASEGASGWVARCLADALLPLIIVLVLPAASSRLCLRVLLSASWIPLPSCSNNAASLSTRKTCLSVPFLMYFSPSWPSTWFQEFMGLHVPPWTLADSVDVLTCVMALAHIPCVSPSATLRLSTVDCPGGSCPPWAS